MTYNLLLDKKELRFVREALEKELDRLLIEQGSLKDDDDAHAELGNDAMVYQALIDRVDRLLS